MGVLQDAIGLVKHGGHLIVECCHELVHLPGRGLEISREMIYMMQGVHQCRIGEQGVEVGEDAIDLGQYLLHGRHEGTSLFHQSVALSTGDGITRCETL